MNCSKQSGVALVQVLLISALLLLLVVQLSRTAQNSVQIATMLKQKSQAETRMYSNFAKLQYLITTQQKSMTLDWSGKHKIRYDGKQNLVEPSLSIELQDLAGLLSTSYIANEWLVFLRGDLSKLDT